MYFRSFMQHQKTGYNASAYVTPRFSQLEVTCLPTIASLVQFLARQTPVGQGLLIPEVSRSHTTTHHNRQESSGRVISPSQRPLPDNTQHSQQTEIHAPCGIRTHNLSRRAAANLCLRPRGHWDQRLKLGTNRPPVYNTYQTTFFLLYLSLYVVGTNKLLQFEVVLQANKPYIFLSTVHRSKLNQGCRYFPLPCLSSYHTVSKTGKVFFLSCKVRRTYSDGPPFSSLLNEG